MKRSQVGWIATLTVGAAVTLAAVPSRVATPVTMSATLPVAMPVAAAMPVLGPLHGGAAPGFSIEQVLSAPFPSELVAAPTGGAVAWVFDSLGARNIWVAAPPNYVAHRVTAYTGDDGQVITDVRWTSGARGLVYVRGGDANGRGEIANPALIPTGVEQAVWTVTLGPGMRAIGAPRRLGEGHSPAPSPNGNRVAYVAKDQIWATMTDAGTTAVQLLHTRGKASALRWSPDGGRLAFVSDRGAHSFVGVYDASARALTYLAPSVDRDADAVWSPDGHAVAFVRRPARTRSSVFAAQRVGQPWSIWIADPATGIGRGVWRAADGRGSVFHELDDADQLFWATGDRIVFPWEHDGWEHLYSVPVAGGEATALTPGEYEIEQAALTADRAALIVSGNRNDLERRHLWRIPVAAGSSAERVVLDPDDTTRRDIEWAPTPLPGGGVALLFSNSATPALPGVVKESPGPIVDLARSVLPAGFPLASLVEPRPVTFPAADGMELHGQLFLPPGDDPAHPTPHPAVVFFHGGSRREMLLGWHYMQYYYNAYGMNQYLASRGYVVLSVNYRSGIGYGLDFREALNYGATGGSEYSDVVGAGLFLRARGDVEPARIGAWGGSYGGYLTALALARSSDLYSAGVDWHGVHDWNLEFDAMIPGWDTERDLQARRLAYSSSPMSSTATWRSPVLLIQGDDDRSVAFDQTVQLAEDLRARGVHVETLVFPDEDHDFLQHRHWLEAYRATAEFLDRMLRKPGA
jgi:dipeptidyl aminopeptidase/acylaminoacyl peptidase